MTGASIVVLPELVSSGHVAKDKREALACAESAEGPHHPFVGATGS